MELDVIDELINDSKITSTFDNGTQEEYMHAVESMKNICREHVVTIHKENEAEGFTRIVQKTGIRELKSMDIQGFECHFCEAKFSDEKYIIVYQKKTHINEIIDKEDEWSKFQKELYYDDIRQDNSKAMVYIVYILDDNSDNIPIQIIESNKTYGRKYVFSEDETITFINGIVKTSNEEIGASPVQEWDRILREEHLTACLTESYAAKKVENYLSGQRFDADYVQDDDYSIMNHSEVTQIKWVKSLDTTGFRDFCFDKKNMTFGQINLFYGANGSGKTSVLEAIEYALTSEVRRVKDFKVKMPTDSYPELHVYDTEAGVRTFTPGFSKKNNKEIERVWYGVPIGRTKSNLNENFNRFNAFDSEAAYEPLATMDDTQVLNVLDILKSMAEQNTQIFFTTANGIMINLFKECFKNTTFDYKEYQFVKRVNRPSEIKESSINDTKSIEELTLDDLTLDFHQFEQIRNILRKNQEKLVAREDWEELQEETDVVSETDSQVQPQIIQEKQENLP